MSTFTKEPMTARTPTPFSECTFLAFACIMGALVSKAAIPGETHGKSTWWLLPTLWSLALVAGLILNVTTGRSIRNKHGLQSQNAVTQESQE